MGKIVGLSGLSAIINEATNEIEDPSVFETFNWYLYRFPVSDAKNNIS
jgi:hypothetical protein